MVKGPKPERVLSPRQTEAFEKLVDKIDRLGGASGVQATFHQSFPATADPEAAYAAAGGRIVASLSAMGI